MFMFVLNFVWNEAIDYLFSLNLGSSGLEVLVLFFFIQVLHGHNGNKN